MSVQDLVVSEAKRWVGTPWRHGARVFGEGVDCGQFLAAVFEAAGLVDTISIPPYPQDFALHRDDPLFVRIVESYTSRVDNPQPGDVVLFKYGRCLSHAGIVIEWPTIVHACARTGMVLLENVERNPLLKRRLAGFWRARGLNEL